MNEFETIYTIVVDKQPRNTPSEEKREVQITLDHPLLKRNNVRDELYIQNQKCVVIRKLKLNEDKSIEILQEPYEEEIGNVDLELFLGDNYIYILEENYMEIYIKYLTHNDLNEAYATKMELTSSITQTATSIMLQVEKKTDKEEIISTINQSAEEISISANKINLNGVVTANENFKILSDGSMVAKNGTFKNGSINMISDYYDPNFLINSSSSSAYDTQNRISSVGMTSKYKGNENNAEIVIGTLGYGSNAGDFLGMQLNSFYGRTEQAKYYSSISPSMIDVHNLDSNNHEISSSAITSTYVISPRIIDESREEIKKNFEKLIDGLDIIKNIDIYKYHLKSQEDNEKKNIGLVIGEKYNYSKEITNEKNTGVNLYSFVSVCCKAIQEQQEIIEQLNKKVEELEVKVNG